MDDDDSTPLPGRNKTPGKKSRPQESTDEEAVDALTHRLKGEAWATQYNSELPHLVEY